MYVLIILRLLSPFYIFFMFIAPAEAGYLPATGKSLLIHFGDADSFWLVSLNLLQGGAVPTHKVYKLFITQSC